MEHRAGKSRSPEDSLLSSISPSGACAAGANAGATDPSSSCPKDRSTTAAVAPRSGAYRQGLRYPPRSCLKSPKRPKPGHPAKGAADVARSKSTVDGGAVLKDEPAVTLPASTGAAAETRKGAQNQAEAQCCAGNSQLETALASDAQGQAPKAPLRPRIALLPVGHEEPRRRSDAPEDPGGTVGEALTWHVGGMLDSLLSDFRSVAHVFRKRERSLLATAEDTAPTSDDIDCNSFVQIPGRLSPLRAVLLSNFSSPARAKHSGSGSSDQRGGVHLKCFAALTAAGSILLLLLIYSLRGLREQALRCSESCRPGNVSSAAVD
ncbi:uncharacterized protein LOC144094558 [Amblyomma americanum]